MTVRISDVFKVATTRPLNALDKVSIAELAQFTPTKICVKYPVAVAEDTIREEWNFEVDHYHDLNYLDQNRAVVWFKDGSSLSFTKRK
jgi:hypothetical protein